MGEQGTRILLRSEDERRLIGVGPQLLSIHNLKPYGGWDEDFRPRVLEAFAAYHDLYPETVITRIGVRYINHITIPGEMIDMDAYFNVGYNMPAAAVPTVNKFFIRLESELEDNVRLATTFASTDAPPDSCSFLLDLDVLVELGDEPLALNQAPHVVDDLRARERIAFEAMIEDTLREMFDA